MSGPVVAPGNRFAKGRSGNPNGRPRKAALPSTSAFDIIVDRKLTLSRNGVAREIGLEEALHHKTYKDAIGGSRIAHRQVLKMILEHEKAKVAKATKRGPAIEIMREYASDSANDAMRLLGIVDDQRGDWGEKDPYDRVLLEPWAVEAALVRGRRLRLTSKYVSEIRRCTRNGHDLRLPDPVD